MPAQNQRRRPSLTAEFGTPGDARAAMEALENHGIDGLEITVLDDPREEDRRPADRRELVYISGRVGKGIAFGAVVGAAVFGIVAGVSGATGGSHFVLLAGLSGAVAIAAGLFAGVFALVLMGVLKDPTRLLARAGADVLIRGGLLRAFKAPGFLAPVLLGSLQGLFPCAMVYAAASRAATAGSAAGGAATMLVFGLGTVPAIFALTTLPAALVRTPTQAEALPSRV